LVMVYWPYYGLQGLLSQQELKGLPLLPAIALTLMHCCSPN